MAGALYVLDTNVLFHLLDGKEVGRFIDVTYSLSEQRFQHVISIVTHGELRWLVESRGWGEKKRSAVEKALENVQTIDIGSHVVSAYVEICRVSRRVPKGSRVNVGENDLWIAATALAVGAPLLTTDKDFDHLHPSPITRHYIDPRSRLVADLPS